MSKIGSDIEFLDVWDELKDIDKVAEHFGVKRATVVERLNKLGKGQAMLVKERSQKLVDDFEKISSGLTRSALVLESMIKKYDKQGDEAIPHHIAISAMREMRETIKMAMDLKKTFEHEIDIQKFIEMVIEEVNKESPSVAMKIRERLAKLQNKKMV